MLRPFLVVPQLIEQPTWGGNYIVNLKKWSGKNDLSQVRIGQSYELTGTSQLAVGITDSSDSSFSSDSTQFETISLGSVLQDGEKMPLLIKINQALGNSFQLHIKPETESNTWKPKPESWYFLEDGYISLGINLEHKMDHYKKTCHEIHHLMKELSSQVQSEEKTLEQARKEAYMFIQGKNPWQYVNLHDVKKHDLIDLSMGGIHHSWEENTKDYPLGNIVFEVQLDTSDDESTIRSFDQGKIKDEGTVRELSIDDYFKHLDTNPNHNSLEYLKRQQEGTQLLRTSFYSVDILEVHDKTDEETHKKFNHLYVRDGDVDVTAGDTTVRVTKGHSCFVPSTVASYTVKANTPDSVILKTFV